MEDLPLRNSRVRGVIFWIMLGLALVLYRTYVASPST
jgi:hypothetical protein